MKRPGGRGRPTHASRPARTLPAPFRRWALALAVGLAPLAAEAVTVTVPGVLNGIGNVDNAGPIPVTHSGSTWGWHWSFTNHATLLGPGQYQGTFDLGSLLDPSWFETPYAVQSVELHLGFSDDKEYVQTSVFVDSYQNTSTRTWHSAWDHQWPPFVITVGHWARIYERLHRTTYTDQEPESIVVATEAGGYYGRSSIATRIPDPVFRRQTIDQWADRSWTASNPAQNATWTVYEYDEYYTNYYDIYQGYTTFPGPCYLWGGCSEIDYPTPTIPIPSSAAADGIVDWQVNITGDLLLERAYLTVEIEPNAPGISASDPLLPAGTGASGEYLFSIPASGGIVDTVWIDPAVAVGYDYTVLSGASFASVELPAGFGDDLYDLYLWDSATGTWDFYGVLSAGTPFDFTAIDPAGVDRFRILGIETSAGLDPADPAAFPTGLSFVGGGSADVSMAPITYDPSSSGAGGGPGATTNTVPEPPSIALVLAGLAGASAASLRRRGRNRRAHAG